LKFLAIPVYFKSKSFLISGFHTHFKARGREKDKNKRRYLKEEF
jgi:hypothetical protein